jgi:hypothetical protein
MKCPGQDRRYWTGSAVIEVPCPECGHVVEVFRDENTIRCARCGHRFLNPGTDFGCAKWCSLAGECLGFTPQRESAADSGEGALAARLIQWVEQEFKSDPACLVQALRVFQYAKELIRTEGGDPRVVLCAALLLATGVHTSVLDADQPRQSECLPTANAKVKEALLYLKLDQEIACKVCRILENCRNGEKGEGDLEFQIVCDSQILAKLAAEHFTGSPGEWENMVATSLRTETAKSKARALFSA